MKIKGTFNTTDKRLVDILVEGLPAKGGWPSEGIMCVAQDGGGSLCWFSDNRERCDSGFYEYQRGSGVVHLQEVCTGHRPFGEYFLDVQKLDVVTKEEYEAALAAKNFTDTKPEQESAIKYWDGEGLPPVGSKVMTKSGEGVVDYVGVDVIVYTNNDGQWSVRCDSLDFSLSAISSPEDVARDEAVNAMLKIFGKNAATGTTAAIEALYDAGYRKIEDNK